MPKSSRVEETFLMSQETLLGSLGRAFFRDFVDNVLREALECLNFQDSSKKLHIFDVKKCF
jgi:hypothetical protein